MKITWEQVSDQAKAILSTLLWALFILNSGITALVLRGNINVEDWVKDVLGGLSAFFGIAALLFIVHKANKK